MDDTASEEPEADPEWLDPEDFPFTEQEVLQAAFLWNSPKSARNVARQVVDERRRFFARRKENEKRNSEGGENVLFIYGRIGDATPWLVPALSVLSESCAARAEMTMEKHWTQRTKSVTHARHVDASTKAGLLPDLEQFGVLDAQDPKRKELLEELRRAWPLLPPPSDEIRRAAAAVIEHEKADWLALASESKRRLDARRFPTDSPPAAPPRP